MNLVAAQSSPILMSKLQVQFEKEAIENGFSPNWTLLIQWAEKYVPSLFIPAVLDVIAGNWSALWTLAASQGPQAVIDLLAALGVTAKV